MSQSSKRKRTLVRKKNRMALQRLRNKEALRAMLEWLCPDVEIFSELKFHGNIKWRPMSLIFLALIWAWEESKNVTDSFMHARKWCSQTSISDIPHTYQGFMGALTKWTARLAQIVRAAMHKRMAEIGGKFWSVSQWIPIAMDGSRSSAPRTEANEKALCAPNYGHGKTARYRKKKTKGMRRRKNERNRPAPQAPQAWITMMWHVGLRLPWTWRLGPSNSSERSHATEMIETEDFPKNTIFCGDAGFVGYEFWKQIMDRGHNFLVRVGANVSLLSEYADYQILQSGIVLCWPKNMMHSNQPPLRLRLVKSRIGKTTVYILTSVLDSEQLTIQQIVRLYKMRWGIEVEFRGLKQTLDRSKLRCHNDRRLMAELDWSILAMAVAELVALKEQLDRRMQTSTVRQPTSDPSKRSLAETVRCLRHCLRYPNEIPEPSEDLETKLRKAVTDSYARKSSKKARYRPPNPDKKPLGAPKVRKLSPQEKKKLIAIEARSAA